MAIVVLRDDLFARGRMRQRSFAVSGLHCALIFIALALLILARVDHPLARNFQRTLDFWGARPIGWARDMVAPVGIIWERAHLAFMSDFEITWLRQENLRLQALEDRAQQDRIRIEELYRLAKFVSNREPVPLLTARVLAGANGYFGHSLLIDAGRNNGVREGYGVHSADGIIGRIIDVTDNTARVLLFSDVESRIPVAIGDKMYDGILAGAGRHPPRLVFTPQHAKIKHGDSVVTSGAAGVLPVGIRIGRVSVSKNGLNVHLTAYTQPLRYVAIEQHIGPAARLTTFLTAKAFERCLEKEAKQQCKTITTHQHLKPFTGARLDVETMQ